MIRRAERHDRVPVLRSAGRADAGLRFLAAPRRRPAGCRPDRLPLFRARRRTVAAYGQSAQCAADTPATAAIRREPEGGIDRTEAGALRPVRAARPAAAERLCAVGVRAAVG